MSLFELIVVLVLIATMIALLAPGHPGLGQTRRLVGTRMDRLALLFEPRDWWFGAYIGEDAVYVGVPLLVVRWRR